MIFAALFVLPALAEECNRGTLDEQYCDRNYDLVADLPLDENYWVDPDTIIFSYTPVEDPAVYAKVWDGFVGHHLTRLFNFDEVEPEVGPVCKNTFTPITVLDLSFSRDQPVPKDSSGRLPADPPCRVRCRESLPQ